MVCYTVTGSGSDTLVMLVGGYLEGEVLMACYIVTGSGSATLVMLVGGHLVDGDAQMEIVLNSVYMDTLPVEGVAFWDSTLYKIENGNVVIKSQIDF